MDALAKRGCEHYNTGNYELAIISFSHALEIQPNNLRLLSRRAAAYQKLSRLNLASADYHTIIKLHPESANSYVLAAKFFLSVSKPAKAKMLLATGMQRVQDETGKAVLKQLSDKCQAALTLSSSSSSPSSNERNFIEALPHEILWYIFEHSSMNTRLTAGLVCRAWRSVLISAPSLWQRVAFEYDREPNHNSVKRRLSLYQKYSRESLKSITICHNIGNSNRACNSLYKDLYGSRYSQLREFSYVIPFGIKPHSSDKLMHSFLTQHPLLVKLEIERTTIPLYLADIFSTFPHLETLSLTWVVSVRVPPASKPANLDSDSDELIIRHSLKNLTLVDYMMMPNIRNKSFWLPNLKNLALVRAAIPYYDLFRDPQTESSYQITLSSLRYLNTDFSLEYLRGDRSGEQPPTQLRFEMPSLEKISFETAKITGYVRKHFSFKNLKSIRFHDCEVEDSFLQDFADVAPDIEEVASSRSKLNKSTLWNQIAKWPKFKLLDYQASHDIVDNDIRMLDEIAPLLNSLDISGCPYVSGVTVVRLVHGRLSSESQTRGQSKIQKLGIQYISSIDVESVNWLRANVPMLIHKFENPDLILKTRTRRGRVTSTA